MPPARARTITDTAAITLMVTDELRQKIEECADMTVFD